VHVTENVADFGLRVFPNSPYSLDLTPPVCLLLVAWKEDLQGPSLTVNAERQGLKRKESKARFFKGEAECGQTWRLTLKNNYAFSSVVAKFYKIFTSVTCKRNEAKIGGVSDSGYKVNRERIRPGKWL
jgi:hypothetical protein